MTRKRVSAAICTALLAVAIRGADAQQPAPPGAELAGVYVAVWVGEVEIVTLPDVFPMTAAAKAAYEAFDPLVSDPRRLQDCAPEKVPTLLWSANPMEIVPRADRLELRYEEGGAVREILLDAGPPAADHPYSAVGYSVGRWEDGALLVRTTHMDSPTIVNDVGHPLSRDAVLTERYWREPGSTTLRLEFQVDDPVNYTDTLTFSRIWERSETDRVRDWDCFSLGPRGDEPPDIDELTRLLETLE